MLEIRKRFRGSCPRHRKYNPLLHGPGAIKAGCLFCESLYRVYVAAQGMDEAARKHDELLTAYGRKTA